MARMAFLKYQALACVLAPLLCPLALADGAAVKIGIMTDETGPYSRVTGQNTVVAAQLAVEDFGGTVLGKPIEIVSADHKNDAARASRIAHAWFETDHVDMIAELTNTDVALSVQEIARQDKKIDIVTGAASPLLTGERCSPTGFHWVYDSYSIGRGTGGAVVEQGDKTWFFITTEAPFGAPLEANATRFITAAGGKVIGHATHPPGVADFSPYLLKAQNSGAQAVAIADAGADAVALVRQAARFGIGRGGQRVAGLLMTLTEVQDLGLDLSQGMVMTTASYWDQTPESRAAARKFLARTDQMPNMIQSGVYSAVLHYLEAVRAARTTNAEAVARKMRELPVRDPFFPHGVVRSDGLMQHDMYLAVVKSPADSHYPWDDLQIVQTIPGDRAFPPLDQSACPLIKK
jgi:branched-chain amino acid transport system substrate-binding protein